MNIIVTGASGGIGYEAVYEMSKDHGNQLIAVSRNIEGLQQLKGACMKDHGSGVEIYAGDLSDKNFPGQLATYIKEKFGSLNILLNNAGQLISRPFEETSEEEMLNLYKVNVIGTAQLIRYLLPLFERGNSHVVNIGSMGGYQGSAKFSGLSVYSSTKAALAGLTECLAEEYKEEGIKFNCLALGAAQTNMLKKAFPTYEAPLTAKQMAKFISDFCINGSTYINGKTLPISLTTP